MDSLSDDLLFQILLLLPADFLYEIARFVCRKWYGIIHSNDFTNAQIRRSTTGLLLQSEANSNPIYVTAIQGRTQIIELSCRNRILGSCNGLVLELHHDDNGDPSLLVTNSATKQPFLLPSIPVIVGDRKVYHRLCRIAYSAASMVYKLTLPYYNFRGDSSSRQHIGLLILTAGVDRSWRNLEVGPFSDNVRSLFFNTSPVSIGGFLQWWREKDVWTLNLETETFTFTQIPLPLPFFYRTILSTGMILSVFRRCREDLLWENWEMEPKSGEWRNMAPLNIDLRPLKSLILQHFFSSRPADEDLLELQQYFSSRPGEVLEPFGWVEYPEVLAFRFSVKVPTCILYNLDTHEIDMIELPEFDKSYRAFPHRNNLVWLR